MKVTPWEVKGNMDYDTLIKQFGLERFPKLPKELQEFVLFRRNIIFAHRDFGRILDAIKKRKPFVMMTGLMPSGNFHMGHKIVADQIVFYQKLGAKVYLAVADIEAYNSRSTDLMELHKTAIEEYLTNYVALGLDLNKCDFYFQSKRSKDGKKANAYYALAAMLARHATFNEFKGVYGELNPGKISSSLIQASDMYHPQLPEFEGPIPTVIPVGADQDPHIRIARDMASRMKLFDFIPISGTFNSFLPGLKGGKMSSSDPTSFIALTDSPKDVKKKVNKYAFSGGRETLEEHRKYGGNPDVDVSFQMLKYGLEEDDKKLIKIYKDYKSGKLLTGELKNIVIDKLSTFLDHHHKKREKAKKVVDKYVKQNF
ncbi:tryptophan--tRNA ligase [Nanoarchaeota archaeon]